MRGKEALREAEKHLEEIERKLKNLVEDLKRRQEQLRADSTLPKTMSLRSNPDSKAHV